jgi:integrase
MIRDLALADLLTVVERSLAAGLTENTVRSIVTAFRSVITWGTERGWFGSRQPFGPPAQLNAAVQRTIRRHFDAAQAQEPSRTIGVDSVSTPAEIKAFAELMDDPLDGSGHYVRLLASSGVRIAEFVALRVEDIDLVHMRVNVERQGRRDRTWSSVEPASATGTSVWTSRLKARRNRTVQVWESARPSLEWLVANAVDGWLVPPPKGQAWWLDSLNKGLNKACAQLGWPDRQRIHRLRHFYATYCLAAAPTGYGFDIADVSRWLGHSSIAVTMDMYQHSTPGADDRAQHVSARPLI